MTPHLCPRSSVFHPAGFRSFRRKLHSHLNLTKPTMLSSCFLSRPAAGLIFLLAPILSAAVSPEGKSLETSAPAVALARDGKALVPVVISPESSAELKQTAADLAGYLKRITGAEFTIKESKTPEGITLGTLGQFPDDSLNEALAIKNTYDGVEAFAIRSNGEKVRLIGNTDLGASHAANRFLELLGRRVFFAGPNWEILPELKTLNFDQNETSRPKVWSRKFGFTRMNIKGDEGDRDRLADWQRWQNANCMGQSFTINTSHAWHAIPTAFKMQGFPFKKEFEEHPEYFALVDGKRTPPQFCVTNAGLQKAVTRYANQFFEVNPTADMVSLDTADQAGWCTCEDCKKLGLNSDQAFYLANAVARDLQKSHPGKYVGVLAYSWHSDPPAFVLEPNVFVMLTAGMNASKLSFDELFDAWTKKCRSLGIYEYFTFWEMDKCMLPGKGPHNSIDNLPARFQRYTDHNVIGFTAESADAWGTHGLGYYVANKVLWDPGVDLKSLKTDFYANAFGPAAPAMSRYYERLDLSHDPFRGVAQLRECLGDLQEATTLAKSRPDVLARLDDLKANLIFTYLGNKVDETTDEAEQKERALEWFKWAFRIRNTSMIDWITFRAAVGNHEYKRTLAAKFNDPSWNSRHTKDNPWRDDRPVTSREIEERLTAIAAEWGKAPTVKEETFSGEIVPVPIENGPKVARKELAFMGTATFLLASPKGEPLKFKLTSAPSPQIERQDAKYSLTTLDGKTLTSGELPEGENAMDLKVPGPGVYKFSCKRGGGGWKLDLPEGATGALLVERGMEFRPQFMTTYFYVPKNTASFTFYCQDGSLTVKDPAGQGAYNGRSNGDFVTVPVGEGMDGKVWSLTGKFRNLWFLNLPTVLSVDHERIFMPKEVAAKDGLQAITF